MAIDSRDKRASAGNTFLLVVATTPDGAIDSEADRRHVGGLYRGIVGATGPADAPVASRRRSGAILVMMAFDEDEN